VAGAGHNDVCLLRGAGWKEVWRVRRPKEQLSPEYVAFSPDGKILALDVTVAPGHQLQGAIHLWDAGTGRELRRLTRTTTDAVTALAYSPDGATVAVGYAYGGRQLSFWDPATGREKWRLGQTVPSIDYLAFSPDGRFLASTGRGDIIRIWEVATGKQVYRLDPGEDDTGKLAYVPDGRRLVSKGWLTVLVWDVTGLTGAAIPNRLDARELQALWEVLAGDDARRAYATIWRLSAAAEQVVPFVGERLRPVPAIARKDVARWIAELDDDDFAIRQRATEDLGRLGEAVAPALREALRGKPSAEGQRRLEKLLELAEAPLAAGERLRELRSVAVLEYAATPEATNCLRALANGAPEARLTREAKAALRRLEKQPGAESK
jgi:hypothetical protein